MKKALSIILAVSMILTMLVVMPLTANANENDIAVTGDSEMSGTTGNCTWKIDNGVLTISGNGDMGNGERSGMGMSGIGDIFVYPWTGYDITEVIIENGVTSIGACAFFSYEKPYQNLEKVSIGDSVKSIGNAAFYGCANLKSITIGNSLTSIGISVFSGCTGITSLIIGNSVEDIASKAFFGCTELKSITIPASVTDIYDKAFGYYYKDGFGDSKVKDFTIYGYKNSEAQRYADDNNFTFVALDDEPSDPTSTTHREIFGDIDGDGEITITDTTFLQRYAVGLPTPYPIGEATE